MQMQKKDKFLFFPSPAQHLAFTNPHLSADHDLGEAELLGVVRDRDAHRQRASGNLTTDKSDSPMPKNWQVLSC